MNITYTGRHGDLPPVQQKKLDAKFAKLGKLVERKGAGKGAHVVITTERHLTHAELTFTLYDHSLVSVGSGSDLFTAVCEAVDKAEKQVLKVLARWRDTKRTGKEKRARAATPAAPAPAAVNGKAKRAAAAAVPPVEEEETRVYRVNHHQRRKPMTLEEAMLEIGNRDYLVYRDAESDSVTTLIRRKDGNFDLVES